MILNQRQYNVTKSQIAKLEESMKVSENSKSKIDKRVYKVMIGGLKSQIKELKDQLKEYDELRNAKSLNFVSIEELPTIMIKARVAKGFSQKDLAKKLKIQPQQIQRYEANNYKSVTFKRVTEILNAMDIELKGKIPLQHS